MSRIFSGKVILFILLLHTADLCLVPVLGIFRPILLYLWVFYIAIEESDSGIYSAAIFAGLLRDLTGSQALGAEAIALVFSVILVKFLILKFESKLWFMRSLLAAVFVFMTLVASLLLSQFLSTADQFRWRALSASFISAVTSSVVMPFFLVFIKKWFPREERSLRQYELFG